MNQREQRILMVWAREYTAKGDNGPSTGELFTARGYNAISLLGMAMITFIDNALELGQHCRLVSCEFNPQDFNAIPLQQLEQQWQITLPNKLQGAVTKRKAEFIAGRYCAKTAIQRLPLQQSPLQQSPLQEPPLHQASSQFSAIGIGEKRQPLWPRGIVGSITHSHGFAAAAVADTTSARSLGIDSEYMINEKTASNIACHILREEENYCDNQQLVDNDIAYLTLIFSAKESIFKCLHPLVHQYFDFKDATISLSTSKTNRFEYVLQKNLNDEFCQGFTGEGIYRFDRDFIHTAVLLT